MIELNKRLISKFFIVFTFIVLESIYLLRCLDLHVWSKIVAVYIILLSLYSCVYVFKNTFLLILMAIIAYFNYSICITNYLVINTKTMYTGWAMDNVSVLGINILLVFITTLVIFLPNQIYKINKSFEISNNREANWFVLFFVVICLLLIFIFAYERTTNLLERGNYHPLYEYSVIFFIVGLLYCGNNKTANLVLLDIALLYTAQNFLFGGRVTGLQILCVLFIFNYNKMSKKVLIVLVSSTVLVCFFIGFFREAGSIWNVTVSKDNIVKLIINLFVDKKFALDTAYAAYYSSLCTLKVYGIFSVKQRLEYFFRWILTLIMGSNFYSNGFDLSKTVNEYYAHHGGQILPIYFYFFVGICGVIFIGVVVNLYLRSINKMNKANKMLNCINVYVLVSIFRWYLYSPVALFRGVILLIMVYYVCDLLSGEKVVVRKREA